MAEHWQSLTANLAVVALFISTWVHGQFIFNSRPRWQKRLGFGIVMGLGAVASMLLAIPIDGSFFDLRLSLVAIAGFFGGPIALAAAVAIAATYRYVVIGGPLAGIAVLSITLVAAGGFLVSRATRHRLPALASAVLLSLTPPVVSLGLSVILNRTTGLPFTTLSIPVALMNVAATGLSAFFIMRYRVVERERDLLRAAFLNSPDFHYVKTKQSRFAAVNLAVVRHNGFSTPADIVGRSDLDLFPGERGQKLFEDEQRILATGVPVLDAEEMVTERDGREVWYLTSKVPLYNRDGELIGLSGVTRDVTARRRLRAEAENARNRLDSVLAGVADGIAMFEQDGTLVYCNRQYRDAFPFTKALRRPGVSLREILQAVADTGEQLGIPAGAEDAWIDDTAHTLDSASEQEIELADGRWLLVRTRPTDDFAAMVVVSDITHLKRTEAALVDMTTQLRELATTDGLTGLVNRRAFDQALQTEVSRAQRAGCPVSVLLCDVDRFKAYNDRYGHQAGDEVLKAVGGCLKRTIRRPGDVVARYGGEEFVAILPNTGEEGAGFIAEEFKRTLAGLRIPHAASEHDVVTASVGVATLPPGATDLAPADLLRRADEALYAAKADGRNRVSSWRLPERRQARA